VRGVKDLGLWESMVCWPLRSEQNAGTGTTAYSLGGLGTFNGTLTNGPTWGVDGLNFIKASVQYIDTQLNPNANNHGVFVCSDWSQVNQAALMPIGTRNVFNDVGSAVGLAIGTVATPPTGVRLTSGTGVSSIHLSTGMPAAFACFSMVSNGSVLTVNRNATQEATHSIVNGTALSPLNIGASGYDAQGTYNGLVSFAMALYAPADNAALYNLYRQTLGTGLGLP
jgi:hypothetical protein